MAIDLTKDEEMLLVNMINNKLDNQNNKVQKKELMRLSKKLGIDRDIGNKIKKINVGNIICTEKVYDLSPGDKIEFIKHFDNDHGFINGEVVDYPLLDIFGSYVGDGDTIIMLIKNLEEPGEPFYVYLEIEGEGLYWTTIEE